MFGWKRKRYVVRRRKVPPQHYVKHKEFAREVIKERLAVWNGHYGFTYKRVAIRNQKTCWGSCSEHGNLNFNYKIIFLPESLMDYVIVHELCHIKHLDHSTDFWALVGQTIPDYTGRRKHLRKMTQVPQQGFPSSIAYLR